MNLFVYGSLQFPAVMARVTGKRHAFLNARLHDHQRYVVNSQTYPGLVSEPGAVVEGMLYLDIAATDWPLLDAFESEYERVGVDVLTPQGMLPAQTYRYLDRR
ncbi:MAG: hypothetical protein RLZZ502_781, partial [Pseudomonadota bacterium]